MNNLKLFVFLPLISLMLSGCASSLFTLDNSGLVYKDYPLKVLTDSGQKVEFINSDWSLENWKEASSWTRKTGKNFKSNVHVDLDEDGDAELVKTFYSDLELVNKVNNAQIFFDLTPISKNKESTEMDFFLDNFVENNASNTAWLKSDRFTGAAISEKSYATKIIGRETFSFQGHDGVIGIVERADLNQLKLDSEHRSEIMAVMFLRVDDIHLEFTAKQNHPLKYPGIITALLVSKPKYFQEVKADFYSLIKQIEIDGEKLLVPGVKI